MFKSYLLFALATVAGLSSSAYSAVATDGHSDQVSNAYAQLIQAEHQLLISELAVETKKSANFEKLLADGHASWLENRQQKLVVDILKAKLDAYEKFESQAVATLTGRKIKLGPLETDSIDTRLTTIRELQQQLISLRQSETKLANGIATLPVDDSWTEGYRLRLALTGDQVDVVAAKILLLEQLNALQKETNEASGFVSTTGNTSASAAAWKRPAKNSSLMQLLITQAELQIQLSGHHLSNETQRLADIQALAGRGMATAQSVGELKSKVEAIRELLREQQDNLSLLKKDLEASPDSDHVYASVQTRPVNKNTILNEPAASRTNLPVLTSVLNNFELGQAHYLRNEAILKGDFYGEVLSKLEQAMATQTQPQQFGRTPSSFSDTLIRGQTRELEQYRWKIKKTDLQRGLADTQIALLEQSSGSQHNQLNMLVSAKISSSTPVTLPSRFLSNDPFGLQTTYSAFVSHSPVFRSRRPALASTRGDYSSVFRPIINRNAFSYYRGFGSSSFGRSYGGINRVHSFGLLNSQFRTPGQSPFYFPGGSSSFGANRFHSNIRFNSFGPSQHFRSSRSYYGW